MKKFTKYLPLLHFIYLIIPLFYFAFKKESGHNSFSFLDP